MVRKRRASFANEHSRNQILCRGQNGAFAIKYAKVQEETRATQKAKDWVKKENRNVAGT